MNKNEYLEKLSKKLSSLSNEQRKEIVADYDKYFEKEKAKGKNEKEIIEDLGDLDKIAREYILSFSPKKERAIVKDSKKDNFFKKIVIAFFLFFFNLIFALGVFVGIWGFILGMYAGSFSVVIAGLGVSVSSFVLPLFIDYFQFGSELPILFFSGIVISCLGILWTIANFIVTKFIYNISIKYIKWNVELIK